MGRILDDEQVSRFDRDGFLVVEDYASKEACAALKAAAEDVVEEFQPPARPSVFRTDEQTRVSDCQFLQSGGGVSCFFEAAAFGDDGMLRTERSLSINKIGHALHDLHPEFERFTYTPELAGVADDIGMSDALALQSMYIFFAELDPAPLPQPSELVPIEVPAGTLVVLHGLLPHWSDTSRSPKSRHAYSVHCISAAAEYPSWNWLQRPATMPLRKLAA